MPKRKQRVNRKPSTKVRALLESTDFCHRSTQFVLSDLPDEILRKICEYLDPHSLIAISKLRIQRLNHQHENFKSADFSVCNTISPEDVQLFFDRERVKHLKDLNFNNVFLVQSSILSTCIEKCKNITRLFVFNCGITFYNINAIFSSCFHLEELYWSIRDADVNAVKRQKLKGSKSIKKLYVQINIEGSAFLIVSKLLVMCPNAEDFCMNFSPCYVTSIPANSATRYFAIQLKLKARTSPLNLILNCTAEKFPFKMLHFVECFCALKNLEVDDLFEMGGDNVPFYFTQHKSSFLQFFDENEQLAELPALKDESVNSMVIIVNQNIGIMSHLSKIKKMTGKALQHLSLYKLIPPIQPPAVTVETPFIRDILCDIAGNSCNISVLDLSEVHMKALFPFSSLCNLKRLKVLNISTCCFTLIEVTQHFTVQDYFDDFQNFVLSCNKVERFGIYGCKAGCLSNQIGDMLSPISQWIELRHLTVQNVTAFRHCKFLIPIANSCAKLKSLEFINVGDPKVCHFMASIKHVLKNAKELTFLRINHPGFYPMDPLLWNSIESAQKLQGLCLSTELTTAIVNKTVLDAITQLPHLHLFHLLAKKMCENLNQQVKRAMTDKGVKAPYVKTSLNAFYESYQECSCRHLAFA